MVGFERHAFGGVQFQQNEIPNLPPMAKGMPCMLAPRRPFVSIRHVTRSMTVTALVEGRLYRRGSLIPLLNNFLPLGSVGGIQFYCVGAARGTDQTFRDQPNTRLDAGVAPGGIRTWQRY